jgi:hypothetical protein
MPNTISQNLTRLQNAKTSIADAIIAKGGTVNSDDGFEDFANDISTISTGTQTLYKPYVEFVGSESFTLKMSGGNQWNGVVQYSTDGQTWTTWENSNTNAISSGDGNKLYLRGYNNTHFCGTDGQSFVFTTAGTIQCNGNIDCLLDFGRATFGIEPDRIDNTYMSLFSGCNVLTKAPDMPATTVATSGYQNMFRDCSNLTESPDLPATSISSSSYDSMFKGCINLTKVTNQLPSLTIYDYSYNGMFLGCSSLTTAPEILATNMSYNASNACCMMFFGCTSLTKAPSELYLTTITSHVYCKMFYGCSSLSTPPKIDATSINSSSSDSCFIEMFRDCTSLNKLPSLKPTTLYSYAYTYMFEECPNIKISTTRTGSYQTPYRIPESGSGSLKNSNALYHMFYNTGGTFTGTPSINTTYYTSNEVV